MTEHRTRESYRQLTEAGVPERLIDQLHDCDMSVDALSERLTSAATQLRHRMGDVIAHVENGDSVNSLGEVQAQGGGVDVLCALYMSARERAERTLGEIGRWQSNHALYVAQQQRREREPVALLRVVFDQPPSPSEITSLRDDIAENYGRTSQQSWKTSAHAFVASVEIVEQQS